QAVEDARSYGFELEAPRFSMQAWVRQKDAVITRLNGIYGDLLEGSGVTLIEGRGRLVGPHTVEVGERRVTAERVLIATGGEPHRARIPGAELGITSDEVFQLARVPERVVIIGG